MSDKDKSSYTKWSEAIAALPIHAADQDKRAAAAKAVSEWRQWLKDGSGYTSPTTAAFPLLEKHADTILAALEQPQPPYGIEQIKAYLRERCVWIDSEMKRGGDLKYLGNRYEECKYVLSVFEDMDKRLNRQPQPPEANHSPDAGKMVAVEPAMPSRDLSKMIDASCLSKCKDPECKGCETLLYELGAMEVRESRLIEACNKYSEAELLRGIEPRDAIRDKWAYAQGAIYAALGWLESDRDVSRAIEILRGARDPGPYHEPSNRQPDGYAYRYATSWSEGGLQPGVPSTVISFELRPDRHVLETIPYYFGKPAPEPTIQDRLTVGETEGSKP